jgi:transglutaminase-like putative cysteine protease
VIDRGQILGIQWFHSSQDRRPAKETATFAQMPLPQQRRGDAPGAQHLAATKFIDAAHPTVRAFAERAVDGAATDQERISRLFTAVRDEIRYDPYQLSHEPQDYVASNVIVHGAAFCIPKAVVLTATARSLGIPARLGFSDVKNHLQSPKLAERMGTDVFIYHGYSELYVNGAWRKATPAFNAELCARFGVPPLTFDGSCDALLHPFAVDGSTYMEYIHDRGVYADLPLGMVLEAFATAYPGFGTGEPTKVDDPAFSAREPR